jgi:hypothetical protein
MINRLLMCFQTSPIAPSLRPRRGKPETQQKTRADIRREILAKLAPRIQNLGISNR